VAIPALRLRAESSKSGSRRFGATRGGRRHAGIDLHAPVGTIVRAMSAGKVLRVYPFYCEIYAIEIDHGTFIARYGKVDKHKANIFVDAGDVVQRGDYIGVVGRLVGIKVPSNMLHLEMYASSEASALTVPNNLLLNVGKISSIRRSRSTQLSWSRRDNTQISGAPDLVV
jgi:murein DD-endopeptidase MepM/ murein hydrolase activator NlpD